MIINIYLLFLVFFTIQLSQNTSFARYIWCSEDTVDETNQEEDDWFWIYVYWCLL